MRPGLFAASSLVLALSAGAALAAEAPVKIGVLSDMSSLYADITGEGTGAAARMAVEDFGGTVLGRPIEMVTGDHQNKADVASAIVRQWYDTEGVDMVTDGGSSAVALAVEEVVAREAQAGAVLRARELGHHRARDARPMPRTGPTTPTRLPMSPAPPSSNPAASPGIFSAPITPSATRWSATPPPWSSRPAARVLGAVYAPLKTADFSSFLLQAQGSKANIIGLANAGGDTINSIKQGAEFGIAQGGQKFAALLMFITDVHSLGLKAAQGLQFTSAFYWDQNAATRAFSKRFFERIHHMPTMVQAGVYSATHHYLEAVKALGSKEPLAVMAKMRATPINDFMTHDGKLRIDGRVVRDMYLLEVKKPEESTAPWDYVKIVETVPGDRAYRPLDEGGCPLVRQSGAGK